MRPQNSTVTRAQEQSLLQTHTVLRNTYMLLSMTLLFSASTAWLAMVSNAAPMGILGLFGMFGLLFLTQALSNSAWGLVSCFAFTGFMGYTLGPILNMYLGAFSNGEELIFTSLGATGITFLALSAYVIKSRQNFTYMGGFLMAALLIAIIASLANIFLQMPMLSLVVSCVVALVSAGLILFQTSAIIEGGERNYIMATISLYVSIFNLFVSLLQILASLAGNRD